MKVGQEEQTRRFVGRINDGRKIRKLSLDQESHRRWYEHPRARGEMFAATGKKAALWYVVDSNDKRQPRLN